MNQNSITYKKCVGQNYLIWVGYAAKKVGLGNAEDLVQSVLEKVWRNIDSINIPTEEHLKRYVYRCIDNAVIDYWRKKANTPTFVGVEVLHSYKVEPKAYHLLEPTRSSLANKMIDDLQLSKEDIELLGLMAEGYKNQEILQAKGLSNKSLGATKSQKSRLRTKLKKYYNALPIEVKKDYEKRRSKKKP